MFLSLLLWAIQKEFFMDLKVGIIGCGGIARSHVGGYKNAGLKVVAVTDSNEESARKMAEDTGAAVYSDYRELLEKGGVDLVSICTPPKFHEEAACCALEKGVHVLCEKPMAFDVAAAYRMKTAAKKSKAQFMPAFRHRFLPAIVALKDLLATGKIGEIVFFNNMFCGPAFAMEQRWFTKKAIAGGGCILDTSSHSVDLFRFLVGEIVSQNAVMHRHFRTTDVEDAGILSVKAVNGAVGAMASGFVAGCGMAFIDIMGTKGQIRYDYMEPEKLMHRLTEDKDWTVQPVAKSWGFAEEIQHFIGAIKGEHPLACTVDDGVKCMEVICSVYPY
jgi:predicted dehydrogenase